MKWLSILLSSWLSFWATVSSGLAWTDSSCTDGPCRLLLYYEIKTDVSLPGHLRWPKLYHFDHTCESVQWGWYPAPIGTPIVWISVAKYYKHATSGKWVLVWGQKYWTTREFADLVKEAADDTTTINPDVHFKYGVCPGDKCKAPWKWDPLTATCITEEVADKPNPDIGFPSCKEIPLN